MVTRTARATYYIAICVFLKLVEVYPLLERLSTQQRWPRTFVPGHHPLP